MVEVLIRLGSFPEESYTIKKFRAYLECECHSSSNIAVHLCLFEYLIILVITCLTDVNDSPGKWVLQTPNRLKINIESNWSLEWCL